MQINTVQRHEILQHLNLVKYSKITNIENIFDILILVKVYSKVLEIEGKKISIKNILTMT